MTEDGNRFGTSSEEQKLIAKARQFHEDLDRRGLLLEQPDLMLYVQSVARPLVPKHAGEIVSFRFHILRLPVVNALALPNGNIYLTVGLLARIENEAEFAEVLGHEIAHVILRHSLKSSETRRSTVIAAHIADLLLMGTSIAYVPFLASMASFSREQEEEADKAGLEAVVAAGYDTESAVKIFKAMQEVKKGEEIEGSAYSSHPTNMQREETLRSLIRERGIKGGLGRSGEKEYATFRSRIMNENVQLKLNARQFEMAREAADAALAIQPGSPWPHYYKGEAYRHMGDDPKATAREHAWLYGKRDDEMNLREFVEAP